MPVVSSPTPNPNAMKFTVGAPVGGPATYRPGEEAQHPLATALLAIGGVTSVFWTADFVTVQKEPNRDWADMEGAVLAVLGEHFPEA